MNLTLSLQVDRLFIESCFASPCSLKHCRQVIIFSVHKQWEGFFNYSWKLLRKPTSCNISAPQAVSSDGATDVIALTEKVLSWTYIFLLFFIVA